MPDPHKRSGPFGRARRPQPEPDRYELRVNGHQWVSGTLQDVQSYIADLVTTRLAGDPELAPEAQQLNAAFTSGAVQRELDTRGEWFTIFGAHSEHALRMKIIDEGV